MFGLDPIYFVFLAPGVLLALWAQLRVQSAYAEAGRVPARSGLSGAAAAQAVQEDARVPGVRIEPVEGDALVAELCRMLGASEQDPGARRHAEELLARRAG